MQNIFKNAKKFFINSNNNTVKEATFEVFRPFKTHRLEESPSNIVRVSKDDALDLYRKMQIIRHIETRTGHLYKAKLIRGFCHLYSGQEAVAVGMKSEMRAQDNVISSYRIHGWAYLMGVSAAAILSEMTGSISGCTRGKSGAMHMYAPNFYGGNGIVGAQVSLGAGVALACQYKGNGGVCLTLYGDGASNEGQVFEAYNMALLWKLPCIFICENNGYGFGTSSARASSDIDYFKRGDLIPGLWIDGMDVLAIREGMKFGIDYALKKGPIVIEAATYRYSGHSMSDPDTSYRTREEIQDVRQYHDPIQSFRDRLIESELATFDEIQMIDTEVINEIDEATEIAKNEPEVPLSELACDIYSNNLAGMVKGIVPDRSLKHITNNLSTNLK